MGNLTINKDGLDFHYPANMAYTCHNEGVCCRVFDTIPVDATARAALQSADLARLNELANNAHNAELTTPRPDADPIMARKPCGDCTMLTDDTRCAIHALHGEPAKPRVCQDFPWRYVETPGGVYVGLSFVCPSVRANAGRLLAEQDDLRRLHYREAASVRSAPNTVSLNGRLFLTWADYVELEGGLQDLLKLDTAPLPTRLIGCCLLPGFISQLLTPDSSQPPGTMAEIIGAMRNNGYQHIARLAKKKTKSGFRARRMFLGMYVSFANTLHRQANQGRMKTVASVMNQYIRHTLSIGEVELKPLKTSIEHRELDTALLPAEGYGADQVERYLRHCIFRKDLVLAGDLTRRIRLLMLNAALIPWYALACAKDDGRHLIADKDWDEAIGHVERLYGFHSAFYRFFEQNRVFADIADSFLLKPAYPFHMFR